MYYECWCCWYSFKCFRYQTTIDFRAYFFSCWLLYKTWYLKIISLNNWRYCQIVILSSQFHFEVFYIEILSSCNRHYIYDIFRSEFPATKADLQETNEKLDLIQKEKAGNPNIWLSKKDTVIRKGIIYYKYLCLLQFSISYRCT